MCECKWPGYPSDDYLRCSKTESCVDEAQSARNKVRPQLQRVDHHRPLRSMVCRAFSWKMPSLLVHSSFCSMGTVPTTSHKFYVLHESTSASYSACHLTLLTKHNPLTLVSWKSKICHEYYQKNLGSVVTKFSFSPFFSQAWCRAVTPVNVIAGFRRAGLTPMQNSHWGHQFRHVQQR